MINYTAIGLGIGFVGAVIFAAEGTRLVRLPLVRGHINWQKKHDAISKIVDESVIERESEESEEFDVLLDLFDRNVGSENLPSDPSEINYLSRFGSASRIAVENNSGDREFLGSPARLRTWVEQETRELFFKWGMIFIAIGYLLQFFGAISI